jgi:enterochelin esterase-like enzyme
MALPTGSARIPHHRGLPLRLGTAVLVVLAAGWLGLGAVGAYRYVHGYWLHRGFPPPVTPANVAAGHLERVGFWSRALHQRREYEVYVPPGYRRAAALGQRVPVFYLLHAPPGRPDGYIQAGAINVRSDVMLAHHQIRPMLLVIPYGKSGSFGNDTEWADAGAGRYEGFVMDVVRDVDHRFATRPDRQHRAIAGLSEGGYGAINVGLHHLGEFSVVESWSGYFIQTPTAAFTHATRRQLYINSPGLYVGAMAARIRRLGLRAYLYQGIRDEIRPWRIRRFAAQLRSAGAYVRWGFFPGGHDWGLWRREMPHMLEVASRWFGERPTVHPRSPVRGIGHPEHPRAGHRNGHRPGSLITL